MDEGCLIHKYTYLLDDGRDVAVVLLHGLGVLVVLEGRHGGAARSPAPRSHLAKLPGALCFESPGFFSSCVDAGRLPSSEPSVYHSRGSHAPPNPSSFPGSSSSLFHSREGGASARSGRARSAARAKMEKELDEEAPQDESDVRRSAPFSPAAIVHGGGSPQRRACAAPAPRGVARSRPGAAHKTPTPRRNPIPTTKKTRAARRPSP